MHLKLERSVALETELQFYLQNKQNKFFSASRLRLSLERLQLEDCPH